MHNKLLLEKKSALLQRVASLLLFSSDEELEKLAAGVSDLAIFDNPMTVLLRNLYAMNALGFDSSTSPLLLLEKLGNKLSNTGYKLPRFVASLSSVKSTLTSSQDNSTPEEDRVDLTNSTALSVSLRQIRQSLVEQEGQPVAEDSGGITRTHDKNIGASLEIVSDLENAISYAISVASSPLALTHSPARATETRSTQLDSRYDQFAFSVNSSTRTAPHLNQVTLYTSSQETEIPNEEGSGFLSSKIEENPEAKGSQMTLAGLGTFIVPLTAKKQLLELAYNYYQVANPDAVIVNEGKRHKQELAAAQKEKPKNEKEEKALAAKIEYLQAELDMIKMFPLKVSQLEFDEKAIISTMSPIDIIEEPSTFDVTIPISRLDSFRAIHAYLANHRYGYDATEETLVLSDRDIVYGKSGLATRDYERYVDPVTMMVKVNQRRHVLTKNTPTETSKRVPEGLVWYFSFDRDLLSMPRIDPETFSARYLMSIEVVKLLTRFLNNVDAMTNNREVGVVAREDEMTGYTEIKQYVKSLSELSSSSAATGDQLDIAYLPGLDILGTSEDIEGTPLASVHSHERIGGGVTKFKLAIVDPQQFSGFIDFDQDYRLAILWRIAPEAGEEQKASIAELKNVLASRRMDMSALFPDADNVPEIRGIDRGAGYFFPTAVSLEGMHTVRDDLVRAIGKVNKELEDAELHGTLTRGIVERIDDEHINS